MNNQDVSTPLYIGLFCPNSNCNGYFLVEWTKEIHSVANGEKVIESSKSLNEGGSAVVRLTIPKEDDIERVVIHVDAIMSLKKELPSLKVFINKGMSIPFEKNDEIIQRKGSWFEGNTMVISKKSNLFCTDCVLTLSLRFTEGSSISVQAQTFKENTRISGKAELDGVQKEMFNPYRFIGIDTKKEEDFVLDVKVHQGKVKIYIDCNTQPQPSWEYHWNYLVENSKGITLTGEERSRCSTETYSVLVYGEESSIYSLRAVYEKSNNKLLMGVGKMTLIAGEISPQEKVTYEVLLPIFTAEEITLDLGSKQPLALNVINCRFVTDCPGLLPANRHYQIANFHGFDNHLEIEKSPNYNPKETTPGELRIKINPQELGCYPILVQEKALIKEPVPVCAYLVTLFNQQQSSVEYTLAAEYKGPNLLSIGEPKFDVVAKDTALYYVLYVPYHEDIESVQIQLTKFSGDVEIFISKTNKYPNHQDSNANFQFSHEGFILFKGLPDTSEAYYIGIYGSEASSFSLSAIVGTQFGNSEESAWTLKPGKPQKGTLVPKFGYKTQYYKLFLVQDNDWTGSLRLTVSPLFGRVLIIVSNNGDFPSEHDHVWKAKGHELEIYSNDFEYKKQALYYVAVTFDPDTPNANLLPDLVYYIAYSVKDNLPNPAHMFLSPNTPFYGILKRGKSQYFESLLVAGELPETIYKSSDSGNLDLYVSTDPQNKYPSQDSYSKTTKDYITLEACDTTASLECPVYITVSSNEDQKDISYSLGTKQDSSVIALEDGREIQSISPGNNLPGLFYYHAVPLQNSVVTVSCPGREVVIYAKRIKVNTESLEALDMKPLDEKIAEFTSSSNNEGVVSVFVPPLANSEFTTIAVSVYFKSTEGLQTTFKILASSQTTQLSIGTPYSGLLAKDHYGYYVVNVMRPDSTLLISLTIEDEVEDNDEGDSGLVISYSENTRPTMSNNQFASVSHSKNHIIEINNMDISLENSMTGNWVIGVYGHTASPFKLTAIYEDRKMVNLGSGAPVEMSLKESSFVYFKFFQDSARNLQINLTKFSGQLNFYVTSIDLNKDLIINLPDQTNSKWHISRVSPKSVITIPIQDGQACVSCHYFMKIEAFSLCKFSLVVNELGNIVPIQDGLEYKGRLKTQESAVFMLKTTNVTQEAQLKIDITGNKLVVLGSHSPAINLESFLWKEILTSKNSSQTISFVKSFDNSKAISDERDKENSDSFYILLYNPTNMPLNFSFNMASKNSRRFYSDNIGLTYPLNPLDKHSFEYYEERETEFEANIIFYAIRKEGDYEQEFLEFCLSQGRKIKAQYWPVSSESGFGQDVSLEARAPPIFRSNESHVVVEQRFSTKSQKGRYVVEILNQWEFPVTYRVSIRPAPPMEKIPLKSHSQIESDLQSDDTKLYSVGEAGKWYLWVYSCGMGVDLKIENGDLETGMVTILKGQSYFYKEALLNEPRAVLLSGNPYHFNVFGKFIMYSSVIDEEKFRDYDVKEDLLGIDMSWKEKEEKNLVTIEFIPVEFKDPELTDRITYKVWLCPDISRRSMESPLCSKYNEKCMAYSREFLVNEKEGIKVEFEGVNYGMYYVKIVVNIEHRGQLIKSLEPYVVGYLNVKDSIFWKIFKVFIGIEVLVVVIFACFKGYMKRHKGNKGVELQKVRKEYNPLEGDEMSREEMESEEMRKVERSEIEIIS